MKFADLSDYRNLGDIPVLLFAILTVDVIVMYFARMYPRFFGSPLNEWYDRFGLSAVLSDVLIILIGFLIARYVYTVYFKPKYGKNPALFLGLVVIVQLIHDILFYYGPILLIPRGANEMMDVFKDYSRGGAKILAGDAGLMIGSFIVASLYRGLPEHAFVGISVVVAYMLPYILYMKH